MDEVAELDEDDDAPHRLAGGHVRVERPKPTRREAEARAVVEARRAGHGRRDLICRGSRLGRPVGVRLAAPPHRAK